MYKFLFVFVAAVVLVGCGGNSAHSDLAKFIVDEKQRKVPPVDAIPPYPSFEGFSYTAASKRSPFDKPLDLKGRILARGGSHVRPDFNRAKEFLEGFDLAALAMVGTLEKGGTLWALVQHTDGEIKPVAKGHFMGKNHGKIVAVDNTKIEVLEIVSDGLDGWVERPRFVALAEKD